MAERYLNDPAFDPFRHLMRDCIIDHWPIATGEIVLGEVLPERKYHSLTSAAREAGVGEKVLEHFLVEAGALSDGEPECAWRKVEPGASHAILTRWAGPLRANNGETTDWLKFTLEGAGVRAHGYAFTDPGFF
jgi:hypothetical protein